MRARRQCSSTNSDGWRGAPSSSSGGWCILALISTKRRLGPSPSMWASPPPAWISQAPGAPASTTGAISGASVSRAACSSAVSQPGGTSVSLSTKTTSSVSTWRIPRLRASLLVSERVAPHEREVVAHRELLDGARDAARRAAVDHDQAIRRRGVGDQCREHVGPRRVRFTGHDDDRARGCLDVHSARSGT